jgi:hypothetical protein
MYIPGAVNRSFTVHVLAIAGILTGLSLVLLASFNPSELFSKWYESNKHSKLGIEAFSKNERQFRGWHIFIGVWLFVGGVLVAWISF